MVCALCEAPETTDLVVEGGPEASVPVCTTCRTQLEGEITDVNHWFCLQGSIWSEVPEVQVVSWRMLKRLTEHPWAADLLQSAYLEDAVLEWAQTQAVRVLDSNGVVLATGDSVTLIRDLDVKGANFTAKRGTLVKNIRVGDDPEHVEGRVNGTAIYLKTCFLKRA